MSCLKQAKLQRLFTSVETNDTLSDLWNGVLPTITLKHALCHKNDKVSTKLVSPLMFQVVIMN